MFSSLNSLWAFDHRLSYTDFEYLSVTTSRNDYDYEDVIEVAVAILTKEIVKGWMFPKFMSVMLFQVSRLLCRN